MREILDPLSHIPGVRLAALISPDGVPIAMAQKDRVQAPEAAGTIDHDEELQGYTALAAGWMAEVTRSALHLSWDAPVRAVLRATQGTLVLQRAQDAIVLAVLECGVPYEELRVPIEGAIARMHRMLRAPLPSAGAPQSPTVGVAPATPTPSEQVEKSTEA